MTHAVDFQSVSKRFRLAGKQAVCTEFWALRDLSFSLRSGESLALIGPNGAGKSTALKLLAGIMPPTQGAITIQGRLSALIELGAGFHPDLTGRENIFLNASVLGLTRKQTRAVFGDIVEFAGIADFLDAPLKHYSSGMHARLGFAVAAHAEPDVLLVDEVLSVGDRVFRARCMDKMRSFLRGGTAIVFVSHDLTAVTSFCDRAILLDKGRAVFSGASVEAVAGYHAACVEKISHRTAGTSDSGFSLRLINAAGVMSQTFDPGDRVEVELRAEHSAIGSNAEFSLSIMRQRDNAEVFRSRIGRLRARGHSACGAMLTLNLPPAEYAMICEAERPRPLAAEARFLIRGQPTSGGLVEINPKFEVTPI
ncbi:MAG TPA: ABC transporter ATP-binding protein [Phycisphaerae bacterium]|nr:ABC transporter ATP-binding protein [Phycisphaerae bacterium]